MFPRSILCSIPILRNQLYNSPRSNTQFKSNIVYCWKEFKWFYTSPMNNKKNKIKEYSKHDSEIKNKNKPIAEVWHNMSIEAACKAFSCDKEIIEMALPQVDINQPLDRISLKILCTKLHKRMVIVKNPHIKEDTKKTQIIELFKRQPPPKPENLVKRPPVVTVMGHVDHGKTTLLDSLRNTFVVDNEFGGITQHIGAFSVQVKSGDKITFIDTPGHAAFTTMRARGAEVTDLVVLVIAADDGVMEQTVESIKIAQKALVKIIVAVNKIDKPQAMNIEVIKEKLLLEGIQVEDKGGDVQIVPISALKKINLDLLVEMILIEAEMMNLRADPKGLVEGVVIEAKKDTLGIAATIIVKRGTLKKGTILVGKKCYARVRMLKDENGQDYKEATPSTPVQIYGWKDLPEAGDEVFEVATEKRANQIVKAQIEKELLEKQNQDMPIILEKAKQHREEYLKNNMQYKSLSTIQERKQFIYKKFMDFRKKPELDTCPILRLILKGDVQGTVEVLLEILASYDKNDECQVDIVQAGVGDIVETDIELSEAFNAIIYAFNVKIHPSVQAEVKKKQIEIRMHNIIYKMVDDLKEELSSRLPPKDVENVLGEATVNENFAISKKNKKVPVAGCKCVKGELTKTGLYRVIRQGEIIYEGKVESMKHHKNEVNVVKSNVECGLMLESFPGEFQPSDRIVCYEIIQVPQKTSWSPGF